MQDQPRTLRGMLTSSKDTAGLMVNLAYGAVYFRDPEMAIEVDRLWEDLSGLAHQMRVVATLAARTRREAEDMAAVLQVIGAMEDLGRDAVDIAHIASPGAGIPVGLGAVLAESGSQPHRIVIKADSRLAGEPLSTFRLPLQTGSRVIAVRRGGMWDTAIEGDTVLEPGDIAVVIGQPHGLARVRELAGDATGAPAEPSNAGTPTDVDGAAEVLRDMQTLSEVAVGLAYAVLLAGDPALADEVTALAERLDQLEDELQAWVLSAAHSTGDTTGLASLLLLSGAARDLGDRAAEMVHHVTRQERMHPVLAIALGESDEVAERVAVAPDSQADGEMLRHVVAGTGFVILALRRAGRYQYRPENDVVLHAGDELIATGPQEGRALLSARCR